MQPTGPERDPDSPPASSGPVGSGSTRGPHPSPSGLDPSWAVPNDVSDYLQVLLRWRRWITLAVGAAVLGSALFSLAAPQSYDARVSLLPEQSTGFSFSSVGEGGLLLDFLAGTSGPRQDARLFLELLQSRTVAERVIQAAGLIRVYELEHLPPAVAMEEAVLRLRNQVRFELSEAGLISIRSRVTTGMLPSAAACEAAAERAAEIANAFTRELDAVNQEKSSSRARMVRQYLETQIRETEARARELSDSLARMQEESGLFALDEQTRAEILTAGELQGKLLGAEIELGILERTMRPGNPQVAALQARVQEMRRQMGRIQTGGADGGPDGSRPSGIPLQQLPAAAQKQGWVLHELKIQQTVYELLSRQFHQARIQETGEIPSFSILDPAKPPVYRSWPKRKILVLSSAFVAAFAAALLAFLIEYRDRRRGARPGAAPGGWSEAWRRDRSDLRRLFGRGNR